MPPGHAASFHEFELRIGLQLGLSLTQPQWPGETEERGKCLQRGVGARLSEELMTAWVLEG